MTIQLVNLGTPPGGVDGDSARTAFEKINQNFSGNENAASRLVVGSVSGNVGLWEYGSNPNGYFKYDAAGSLEIIMNPTIDGSLGSGVVQSFTLPIALTVGPAAFAFTPSIQSVTGSINEGWARVINSCMVSMQSDNVVGIVVTSQYAITSNACTLTIKGRWY